MRRVLVVALLLVLTGCSDQPAAQTSEPEPRDAPARPAPWDPRDVDELPAAGPEVVAGLPETVTPPDQAPLLEARPMAAAVLTVASRDRRVQLLGPDGSWREVRPSERHARVALSADGTRLAALLSDCIELWHLPTGERTELPLPRRFQPWDFSRVEWAGPSTLLLDDHAGGWRINAAAGTAERTGFPRRFSWTVDEDGVVVEATGPTRPPALIDLAGGEPRRIDLSSVGQPIHAVADSDVIAGTAYAEGGFAAFAVDRAGPERISVIELRDFEANYSNWALRTVAVLDDASVLLWIAVPGRRADDGWRLVRWEPTTDRLEVVTTSAADPTWSLTLAAGLLEGSGRR